jgi:hypothetical protein
LCDIAFSSLAIGCSTIHGIATIARKQHTIASGVACGTKLMTQLDEE